MALVTKNDVTQIFAIQAPSIDLPPTFANYPRGWDTARSNNGKPTIKQFNYIQQRTDQNVLWIHQNGAGLPYDAAMEYAENAHVVKDGELQKKDGASWVSATNKGYNLDYFVSGKSYPLHAEIMLENGDIVKSTVADNNINPNVDMTVWSIRKPKTVVETMADLRLLKNTKEGELVFVKGYYTGNFALTNPYEGGGDFVWAGGSTVTTVQGIIEQATGVATGRYLRVIDDGVVNVLFCGAKRDGVTETHIQLKIALQYAINNNMQCYAPTGTYLAGGRIDPTFTNGKSLYFFGDGSEYTIFKERDGLTLELGRFNMTFYFLCPDNTTVNTMSIKSMRVNKNGITSPAPVGDVYLYEQAHCFGLASTWTNSRVKNLIMDDVVTEDKIGAGVCLTQGYFDNVDINNIHGVKYQHVGGQRGDFEFQAVVVDGVATGCTGKYVQCEPNMLTAPSGYKPRFVFTDCSYDVTEFTAYRDTHDAQTLILNNHTANELCLIRWSNIIVNNSRLRVRSLDNTYWEGTAKGSVVNNSQVIVGVNSVANTFDSFYPRSATIMPTFLKFKDCNFTSDATANATTTGFAINNSAVYSGVQDFLVEFEDTSFDSIFERTANCYANGNYTFKRCKLAARSGGQGALNIGGYSTYYSNVILESNDLSQIAANYILFNASNTLWSVNFKGVHDFSKCGFGSSNLANTETSSKSDGYFTSDSVPTVKGILGWRIKINKPIFGSPSEYICTTTHSVTAVYQLSGQAGVKLDTTANRPTGLTAAARGLRYLDTTLAAGGKPIQYNGTGWTDSLGAVV